jgi:hypothetical protein
MGRVVLPALFWLRTLTRTFHEATAAAAKAVIPNGVARDFASRAKRAVCVPMLFVGTRARHAVR